MKAKLIVIDGEAHGRQYDLTLPAVVGRGRDTGLPLGHPLVSRQHCELFEADGMLMVRDLGSRNGTFIGELRLAEQPVSLKPGDLITVGPITFQAVYLPGVRRAGDDVIGGPISTGETPPPGKVLGTRDTTPQSRRPPSARPDSSAPQRDVRPGA